jgi:uncharacterized Rmd1/YagE family protein
MSAPPRLAGLSRFSADALTVGERIELRRYRPSERLATTPLTVPVGAKGIAVLFAYGVVVFFGVAPEEQAAFLEELGPYVQPAPTEPESEQLAVRIEASGEEGMLEETVVLRDAGFERLQLVAEVLAKSVVLAVQEATVADAIERIEPFARELHRTGRPSAGSRELLRFVGDSLLREHQILGRVEVTDRPELLWERPGLEGLYLRLEQELEIRERHAAIEHKLDLVSRTARTGLELLYERRSLRVEWYIVILILAEIGLTLYELFLH